MKGLGLLHVSLEGNEEGIAEPEIEFTSYGRLPSFDVLDNYEYEDHVQVELAMDVPGLRMRIRSVDSEKFLLCVKKKLKGSDHNEEGEIEISKDMFDMLMSGAEKAVYKRRYFIPHDRTGLTHEIDVFTRADGALSAWVKVDLEIPQGGIGQHKPANVPFHLDDLIDKAPKDYTAADRKLIDRLWDEEWSVPIGEK